MKCVATNTQLNIKKRELQRVDIQIENPFDYQSCVVYNSPL